MYEDVLKNVKFLEVLMGRLLSITTFSESLGISMTFPWEKKPAVIVTISQAPQY